MNLGKESEFQEHKESLAQLDKGIKSMTAMLNKHYRAVVYFGVNDEGEVIGLRKGPKTQDNIRERISVLVQPKPSFDVVPETDEKGLDYIVLKASGTDTPYSCDGRYYIRNVASDEMMDNAMVRKAVTSGGYDTLKETTSPVQKLSFDYLYSYLASNGIHVRKSPSFLAGYGLLNSNGEYNYIAYLLSDKNNVSIKVVRFGGVNKSAMSSRTEFGYQSLLSACQAVLDHVKAFNITKVKLDEGQRIEKNLFDYESFREAWINAVVHNDWLHMVPPAVFIYDDRIEVSSYGSIPFNMDKDDFFRGKSVPINPSLFNIFSISSFTEQSGHGVPIIVEHYSRNAFNFSSNMIVVTIAYSFTPESIAIQKGSAKAQEGLRDSQKKVLIYLTQNPSATLSQCAEEVGLSLGGVKKIVKELQLGGLIRRIGGRNGGSWTI